MARTGRPCGFDKEVALERAMLLFWEQGYEATSLAQLRATMGDISSASFYAAFDSKEALFWKVLDRYLNLHGQVVAPLRNPDLPPREAVERTLRQSARMQTDPGHPPGCLVVFATSTCSPENRHIQSKLAAERERNRAGFLGCVRRAIEGGELPQTTDPVSLSAVFETFLAGLSVQARDGVPLVSLDAAISQLMRVWDLLAMFRGTEIGSG